jgi:hypothetical protein
LITKLADENTLIALHDNHRVPSCVGIDISSLFNGYESPQSKSPLDALATSPNALAMASTPATPPPSPKISLDHSQSTEFPNPLQPLPPQRRRSHINDFYQNDTMRRTISGSSTHSKEGNQNDKWEWDNVREMMKPSSKSDEFVTFPRNTNLTTNTSDVIDVSSLALSPVHAYASSFSFSHLIVTSCS